jgi:hypothetical protein
MVSFVDPCKVDTRKRAFSALPTARNESEKKNRKNHERKEEERKNQKLT